MSQATSISNLCNQRAIEIQQKLSLINNSTKKLVLSGDTHILQNGVKVYEDVVDMVKEKGLLHATQAFLMENIKEKERMLKEAQKEQFKDKPDVPEYPKLKSTNEKDLVDEKWGWDQLTTSESADYLEAEAMASHIGQFIHKGGKLDTLRKELPNIINLEWTMQPGKAEISHPVSVMVHHDSEELLKLHEELSAQHRKYEQKVNYFKAKVKNLVTLKNSKLNQENANLISEVSEYNNNLLNAYNKDLTMYNEILRKQHKEFESKKQIKIKDVAALRIKVEPQFKKLVDEFMDALKEDEVEKE